MKTLKQLADSIGTSKTTVRNRLIELELMHETAKNDKGVIIVPDHVCEILFDSFQKAAEQSEKQAESKAETETQQLTDSNTVFLSVIETLQQQLTAKDAQITELTQLLKNQQTTIDNLSFALNNAQALNAGTLQTFQQLTAQQAEHTDTASTPDAEIQHKPQAEAEPAQPAEPQQPQQATGNSDIQPQPEPPKAADTSDTPSEPPQSPTITAIKQSSNNIGTAQNNRVRPLSLLQSLLKRK